MGVSRFSVESFSPQSAGNFRRGTALCCVSVNFRQRKRFWMRGGGVSRLSVEHLFVLGCQSFRRGTLLCYVSENFR